MFEDSIKIKLQIDKDEDTGHPSLVCYVNINGVEIDSYCEFTEFMFSSADNRDYYTKRNYPTNKQLSYSSFEPFTCSCGISGCAGIYDGIYTRYRKHSIEWRIPEDCGYDRLLDKTFYSFSRKQYQAQVDYLWKFIDDHKDELVYDLNNDGYWDEDSDEWVDQINLIKLDEQYKWLYKEK